MVNQKNTHKDHVNNEEGVRVVPKRIRNQCDAEEECTPDNQVILRLMSNEEEEEMSSILQDECEEIGNVIARIPGWDSLVQAIDEGDSDILDDLITAMEGGLSQAGSNDHSSLMDNGLIYVAQTLPGKEFNPRIPLQGNKSAHCGFLHPQITKMLCPIYHLKKLQDDHDQ
ncbi:hypothetical protein K443DRAFT_124004 [Laccaria amethystina LaAM-08-1]|uniref:Unplaced genomic scaffold K443scaffold_153, whole genome shotgun sequence n=1 Tax=Laccaria amethystina LaAM-08-1 TaxID=1095629 RepID=A0A0C9XNN9_9AGAR|nr:hypothetical protein K443DRAFT_124004 [Laccaria amethystina LaAM-08-1]